MMSILAFLAAVTAGPAATPPSDASERDPWPDAVVLKSDSLVRCRILSATPSVLSIEYPKSTGAGATPTRRDLRWSDLKAAEFSMDPEFHRLTVNTPAPRDAARIDARWTVLASMVGRPNHPAGELALALARLALGSTETPARRRALDACRTVAADDWNVSRRNQARWHCIQLLEALGQGPEAIQEARHLLSEAPADPDSFMPTLLFTARHDFAALRQLEQDNPRWIDDDLVRPERMAFYHRALDAALKPALFAGGLEGPASEGLWLAVDILEFAGNRDTAAKTARDLIALYPDTRPAARARKFLDQHQLAVNPSPDPAETDPPPATAETDGRAPDAPAPHAEPPVRRRPRYAPTPESSSPTAKS